MSRRTERVAEVIREVVSHCVLFELSDPRIQGVTVVRAEVSGDLRHAKVFVSLMGEEREQKLAEHGLRSARGYLQRKLADRLATRYTPVIDFVIDAGVKRSLEMSRLLRDILPEDAADEEPTEEGEAAEPGIPESHEDQEDDPGPPTA